MFVTIARKRKKKRLTNPVTITPQNLFVLCVTFEYYGKNEMDLRAMWNESERQHDSTA